MKLKPKTKALIEKWVEALESGKYRQGAGCLATVEKEKGKVKHCCLGVLCELIPGMEIEKATFVSNGIYTYKSKSESGVIPRSIVDDYGLSSASFSIDSYGMKKFKKNRPELYKKLGKHYGGEEYIPTEQSLVYLNDSAEFKFKEIAQVLRGVYLEK